MIQRSVSNIDQQKNSSEQKIFSFPYNLSHKESDPKMGTSNEKVYLTILNEMEKLRRDHRRMTSMLSSLEKELVFKNIELVKQASLYTDLEEENRKLRQQLKVIGSIFSKNNDTNKY